MPSAGRAKNVGAVKPAVTVTKEETKTKMGDFLVHERRNDQGQPVFHIHKCSKGHEWNCDSAYCPRGGNAQDCVEHGGLAPIIDGREPWRGR